MALALIFTGCKADAALPAASNPTIQTIPAETTPSTAAPTDPGTETLPESSTERDAAKVLFERILWEDEAFFLHDPGLSLTLEEFCSGMGAEAAAKVSLSSYTLADLDADNIPELLLGIVFNGEYAYGTLVLHCNDGVTGYDFTYRQLMDVKADGTFRYSGGAADNGIARLRFTEDGWEYVILGCTQYISNEEVSFFWDGQSVDQDTYNAQGEAHNAKQDPIRIRYPGDSRELMFPPAQ